jgi:hypothetical protein
VVAIAAVTLRTCIGSMPGDEEEWRSALAALLWISATAQEEEEWRESEKDGAKDWGGGARARVQARRNFPPQRECRPVSNVLELCMLVSSP